LERLKNDIMLIKAQKESFARRLRHLLESQIELIHVLEMDDVGYDEEPGKREAKAPEQASEEKREGGFQRKKIELPLRRSGSPLVHNASNRLARETKEESAANEDAASNTGESQKEEKPVPRISDQFIT